LDALGSLGLRSSTPASAQSMAEERVKTIHSHQLEFASSCWHNWLAVSFAEVRLKLFVVYKLRLTQFGWLAVSFAEVRLKLFPFRKAIPDFHCIRLAVSFAEVRLKRHQPSRWVTEVLIKGWLSASQRCD
jgi:hypothetical protein